MAHKSWLVGVGAYDSGREKAADKIDQLFVDSTQFVNELLEKGESIESQIQEKLEASNMLKSKIAALKSKFGFGNENRDQQIDMLTQRVDSLIEVVAKLAQQKAAEKKATTTKKAPTKKAVKPATKATATKTAAKAATSKAPAKTAAKATSKKAPVKPASKTTATKATAKTAAKPAVKETATKTSANPVSEAKAEVKD